MDAKCQRCLMKPNCPWELLQQHRHPQEEPRSWWQGAGRACPGVLPEQRGSNFICGDYQEQSQNGHCSFLCRGTGDSFLGSDSRGTMASPSPSLEVLKTQVDVELDVV